MTDSRWPNTQSQAFQQPSGLLSVRRRWIFTTASSLTCALAMVMVACGGSDAPAPGNTAETAGTGGTGTAGSGAEGGMAGTTSAAGSSTNGGTPAPEFPAGTGQQVESKAMYPAGPYGVGVGSVIPNYQVMGFAVKREPGAEPIPLQLADWYNPHADDPDYKPATPQEDDRLFPPGSPYGEGRAKPKAFVLDISAVWCGPCQEESKTEIPKRKLRYDACGGDFFLVLADGTSPGDVPSVLNTKTWASKFKTEFPVTVDPSKITTALFDVGAFPFNAIVDARTMTILLKTEGVPTQSFFNVLEKAIGYSSAPKDANGNCTP
jgi:hypothetical protein